jgi:hypothetical protein
MQSSGVIIALRRRAVVAPICGPLMASSESQTIYETAPTTKVRKVPSVCTSCAPKRGQVTQNVRELDEHRNLTQ